VAAPPLDSPCDGPVTYPGDTKILVKFSKGRSGPTLNTKEHRTTDEEMGGGTNFILRIKEQETRLTLQEHDDDDDDDDFYINHLNRNDYCMFL